MKTLAGIEYQERGAGAAVCLVHAGVFGAWFEPVFHEPALDRFRLIRPIRPGYGGSRTPSAPASLAAQAVNVVNCYGDSASSTPIGWGIPPVAASDYSS